MESQASVDHTDIDLIARNPVTKELMGISVKSRSRKTGTEKDSLGISNGNFKKMEEACKTFGCKPYFALLIDADNSFNIFILSKAKLLKLYPKGQAQSAWRMGAADLAKYKADKEIIMIEFKYETLNWWSKD